MRRALFGEQRLIQLGIGVLVSAAAFYSLDREGSEIVHLCRFQAHLSP
jgi:hypothetical protein